MCGISVSKSSPLSPVAKWFVYNESRRQDFVVGGGQIFFPPQDFDIIIALKRGIVPGDLNTNMWVLPRRR